MNLYSMAGCHENAMLTKKTLSVVGLCVPVSASFLLIMVTQSQTKVTLFDCVAPDGSDQATSKWAVLKKSFLAFSHYGEINCVPPLF